MVIDTINCTSPNTFECFQFKKQEPILLQKNSYNWWSNDGGLKKLLKTRKD